MKKVILLIAFIITSQSLLAKEFKKTIAINSEPVGTLVSLKYMRKNSYNLKNTIAGVTPFKKEFTFKKKKKLMLTFEKRGYLPLTIEIKKNQNKINIQLQKKSGISIPKFTFPKINKILLIPPKIDVVERGFKTEAKSTKLSNIAENSLKIGIKEYLKSKFNVIDFDNNQQFIKKTKSVIRNSKDKISKIDPIKLKYLTMPQFLKSKSSIKACIALGKKYEVEAILVVLGHENIETKGMKAGKIGITVGGTLSSYASSYNQAVSRGDSFFVYNVYTPEFAEGTALKVALIDTNSGEIIWINRGVWGKIDFSNGEITKKIIFDLFSDLLMENS